ncbi:MAG: aminodeoxychorismate synthase component I [Betaproteobacteria bacterium]|nr:aminodeoxychorismate synthase component I [Betaproteobacteria bacterium]MDE2131175.1 aminodeoxychorismate synthase component I [Betaproteobacteria bacterium]MDE2211104.1 aminodeoxychorismate synthase component I [Betaproteobacteria bacterium]
MRLVLDFADSPGHVVRRTFSQPKAILTAHQPAEVGPLLEEVDAATRAGAYAAGFVSYECAPAFDPVAQVRPGSPYPLACFGIFDAPQPHLPESAAGGVPQADPWRLDTSEHDYETAIGNIREAIARGDTYQINYTVRAHSRLEGSGLAYYERLRLAQRADYAAWIDCGSFQILSLSPELFFSKTGNRVVTRPMKGTVRRGAGPEEDEALAAWLSQSRKNRAENLMIVDLLRNDLSRVAAPGSVEVPALFSIERYPTVLQMTSTVAATLREGASLHDLFAALFPCGSITGAPKLKSMELIRALERTPRGPYCGAVGWIRPGGDAQFNVAIRTLVLDTDDGRLTCGLGGGITWDSRSDDEYAEVLTKARFLEFKPDSTELLETMLLRNGTFWLQDLHLARLSRSAQALGFPAPTEAVRALLSRFADQYPAGELRVRLRFSREGTTHLEGFPLAARPRGAVPVSLARTPVQSGMPLLRHKTTDRSLYEEQARAALSTGDFDVLLWNEQGEATEFTRGNLAYEMAGRRHTPPVESGLLPGTFRQQLLDSGELSERRITLAELARVDALWFINSVRGWVPVRLSPEAIEQTIKKHNLK